MITRKFYDPAIDQFRDITDRDIDSWKITALAYSKLRNGILKLLVDHRKEVWRDLTDAGLVEGDDPSDLQKLLQDYQSGGK